MSYWENKRIDSAMELMQGYAGQSQKADRELERAKRPSELVSPDYKDSILYLNAPKKEYKPAALVDIFFIDPFTGQDVRKPGDRFIALSMLGVMENKVEEEDFTVRYVMTTIQNAMLAGNAGYFHYVDVTKYTKKQKEGDEEITKRAFSNVTGNFPMYWTDGQKFIDPDNRQFDTPEYVRVFEWENRIRIYKPELAHNAYKSSVHIDLGCYR